jgi:pyruvate dehydrogenase E2 component (dihydrolipoamide acetyltransferase)
MAKIVDMPKLSPTMEEGLLATWHKKEGDPIQIDDLLAEVETDKATMEFRSFDKGTLLKILVAPGSQVKLGQPVAVVGNPGEDISALLAGISTSTSNVSAQSPRSGRSADTSTGPEGTLVTSTPTSTQTSTSDLRPPTSAPRPPPGLVTTGSLLDRTSREPERASRSTARTNGERVAASPYVRKAARERGIDLHGAVGSGPGGRIVAKDLDALATRDLAKTEPGTPGSLALTRPGAPLTQGLAEPEAHPLSMMRKTIARRLTEAKQTVPHFYLTIDVDADRFVALREEINAELASSGLKAEGDKPLKISLNDLLIKACAVGLRRVPECNATFTPEAILVHRRVDISVAVAVPDGLVTPVVRNADQKSVVAIARETRELAARARAKKLKPEEMLDGTFSISNLGMFGIDVFSAVINPPEGAILAVGQVREEPVVKEGAVVAGKRLGMTLSCDHRVVDGAVGAAFLAELRALIEHPMRILSG